MLLTIAVTLQQCYSDQNVKFDRSWNNTVMQFYFAEQNHWGKMSEELKQIF